MDKNDAQRTLDRLLEGLKSGEPASILDAISKLGTLDFSSSAIRRELEHLGLTGEGDVQSAAVSALSLTANQKVAAESTRVPKVDRRLILQEIRRWEQDGLIQYPLVALLKRRYDFDLIAAVPSAPAQAPVQPARVSEVSAVPEPVQPEPQSAAAEPRVSVPAGPRPSLLQTLLSESSIKVYLYLGSFFVIASAIILAALVEAARLPILAIATVSFGIGAFVLRRRLPQPSFALFIIFSFLLPISATVLEQSLGLAGLGRSSYWIAVFIGMAALGGVGTFVYESRFFSVAAFAWLCLALNEAAGIFQTGRELNIFLVLLGTLLGLRGVELLGRWKNTQFARPLFWLIHTLAPLLLLASLTTALARTVASDAANAAWLVIGATWVTAAILYLLSDRMVPILPFMYPAVGALLPLPWFFLRAFDVSDTTYAFGFAAWGALLGIASEAAIRFPSDHVRRAHWPLLAGSMPPFLVAILLIMVFGGPSEYVSIFALSALAYAAVHLLRPRWYVWSAALLSGLAGYVFVFTLPQVEALRIPLYVQLAIGCVLLVTPELFARTKLTFENASRWPALALGILVSLPAILLTLMEVNQPGRAAIIWLVFAVLFALHAFHSQETRLVYAAVTASVLTIVYSLWHFKLDLWLPALTVYSVLLYVAGLALRRRSELKAWGTTVINSGLALGLVLALTVFSTTRETGGWYILIVAGLFAAELFARPLTWLELAVEALLSLSFYQILQDFRVQEISILLFGLSVIWLGGDLAFANLIKTSRDHGRVTLGVGSLLALGAAAFLVVETIELELTAPQWSVYAVLFLLQALLRREPRVLYLASAAAAAVVLNTVQHFDVNLWLPSLTAFSVLLYAVGLVLRRRDEALQAWGTAVINSGLVLGVLVSLAALVTSPQAGGWHVIAIAAMCAYETFARPLAWLELAVEALLSIALFLILSAAGVPLYSHLLFGLSLIWLGGDLAFSRLSNTTRLHGPFTALAGFLLAFAATITLLGESSTLVPATRRLGDIYPVAYFVIYASYFVLHAFGKREPRIGYMSTGFLVLAILRLSAALNIEKWLFPLIAIAAVYYLAGYSLRRGQLAGGWEQVLRHSGLGLGLLTALSAPLQGGLDASIPVAIAATLFAVEAIVLGSVWLALPANALYLMAYLMLLIELRVDEPQYYSIGTALLGMLMHYLLTRAGSRTGAFIAGILSQLVLLGTTYYQMVSTSQLSFFFVLFVQSIIILAYGIVMRSRSLVLAPIGFAVLAVVTVLYSALKNLSLVILIGVTGITLLVLGILAVIMRERITTLAERFSDWNA